MYLYIGTYLIKVIVLIFLYLYLIKKKNNKVYLKPQIKATDSLILNLKQIELYKQIINVDRINNYCKKKN